MVGSMTITNAKYNKDITTDENVSINCVADEQTLSVPINPANRHYAEILRQVDAGTITIEDAD